MARERAQILREQFFGHLQPAFGVVVALLLGAQRQRVGIREESPRFGGLAVQPILMAHQTGEDEESLMQGLFHCASYRTAAVWLPSSRVPCSGPGRGRLP